MWAQTLTRPGHFEMDEVATPAPADLRPGETLLRVLGGAICGSDLPYFSGRLCPLFDDTSPLAAGRPGFPLHEVVGEVVATTDPQLAVGSRAVGWASSTNAMAEYVVTANDGLWPPAAEVGDGEALILQPLACVLDVVARLRPGPADRVAVLGLGAFGLLLSHVLRDAGVASVTGVDRLDRSHLATAFGVDEVVHSSTDRWAMTLADDARPTIVVEAIGHQTATLTDAIASAAPGGRVFCFGLPDDVVYPVPFRDFFRKGLTITGGVVEDRRGSLRKAADYLARHPHLNEHFVTDTFTFDQAQEAFERAAMASRDRVKVQLLLP